MAKEDKAITKFGLAITVGLGIIPTAIVAPLATIPLGIIATGFAISGIIDLNKKAKKKK